MYRYVLAGTVLPGIRRHLVDERSSNLKVPDESLEFKDYPFLKEVGTVIFLFPGLG